jgi:uncharacterized protein YndB with AHSA1/START domain
MRAALKPARKFRRVDSGYGGSAAFENSVHIGMRQGLGQVRLATAEIPAYEPVMADAVSKLRRGVAARMTELTLRWHCFEHATCRSCSGIERLAYRCGVASRFSNRGHDGLRIFSPEDKGMSELLIRKSIDVNAPVATLWKVLTDSDYIRQYMFGCNAETDWKPGSPLLWRGAADGVVYVKGHVVRFEAPYLLEYTIFDPNSKMADVPSNYLTMKYELTERSPNGSLLEITQGDFSTVEDGERRYRHSMDGDDSVLIGIKRLAEAQAS